MALVTEPQPTIPDYMLDPNAVTKDEAVWRNGKAPDYSNTRRVWQETKRSNHAVGSLPNLVENLVKNWEIEASFKSRVEDWRTVDHSKYTFAINGGPPQDAAHMLKVGTYNAIIAPSSFYSPEHMDLEKSHKVFKDMMPAFAWEVLEVYSGPPVVVFKWRHWGEMKNDYEGLNDKGEKVTFKAHGGLLDIQGVTVAKVDEGFKVQSLETWFDPLEMFRQLAPKDSEVDGKSLSAQPADKSVQSKDGIEACQALGSRREGEPAANAPGIELENPHVGAPGEAHSEDRSQLPGASGCPFVPIR